MLTGIEDELILVVSVSSSLFTTHCGHTSHAPKAYTPKALPSAAASASSLTTGYWSDCAQLSLDTMHQIERASR